MANRGLDVWAIRYAVRIARRLELNEKAIRSMVRAALEPHALETSNVAAGRPILAVVGTLQALRLWGWDQEAVLTQIKRRAGTHLDPVVVGEFLSVIREDATASFQVATTRPRSTRFFGRPTREVEGEDVRTYPTAAPVRNGYASRIALSFRDFAAGPNGLGGAA